MRLKNGRISGYNPHELKKRPVANMRPHYPHMQKVRVNSRRDGGKERGRSQRFSRISNIYI